MRFFLCKDKSKFTKSLSIEQYGDWYFIRDNINVWEGPDYLVLYCGYLIEGDIIEACKNFSFNDENGNFFAIKLTKDTYEISLDYFQNHKIFVADKYGIEISNYIPYMTINKEDIVRTEPLDCDNFERELSDNETTTFYEHIKSFLPSYDYLQDVKDAIDQEVWKNEDELAEYIHECMLSHSDVIKENYTNRFISLSEGIDSAVQSQYFYFDQQYLYDFSPCDAGEMHLKYIKIQQAKFPNTNHYTFYSEDNKKECIEHLVDSSCRWQSILPTSKQINMCIEKPDIVLYGVNGNEMFVRDLVSHMLLLCLKYYEVDTEQMKRNMLNDLVLKQSHYGVTYSLPSAENEITVDIYIRKFLREWFLEDIETRHYLYKKSYEEFEHALLMLCTPKLYTRMISANNDVMCSSLYNDRRIYHEFLKMDNRFLEGNALDGPIQRTILKKFNHSFTTPSNDVLVGDYEELFTTTYEATHERDLGQYI